MPDRHARYGATLVPLDPTGDLQDLQCVPLQGLGLVGLLQNQYLGE